MKTNTIAKTKSFTHEGAKTTPISPIEELRRTVLACLLWEDQFYESGESIADRIKNLVAKLPADQVSALAIQARTEFKLRHVPLLLARELARKGGPIAGRTITEVIQRADELSEFLSLYWKDGKTPLSKQVKLGLANAFRKFDAYALGKYRGDDKAVKLRDVLFLTHAKPKDEAQAALWKSLVDKTLESPDTWEVALSGGADKKKTFERLIRENKLGYLALLRNLRNMLEAGCDETLVRAAISAGAAKSKALPFRFIAAAKAAPKLESQLDAAMLVSLAQMEKLPGKTLLVVDVSGSMYGANVSAKSDINRAYAACALAALCREMCSEVVIYATAGSDALRKHQTQMVPDRHGMALIDTIYGLCRSLGCGGIFLKQVCDFLATKESNIDRMIVVTDEVDCGIGQGDGPNEAKPLGKTNYILNVASFKNGIGYGKWTHITGFSEAIMTYIVESERASSTDR